MRVVRNDARMPAKADRKSSAGLARSIRIAAAVLALGMLAGLASTRLLAAGVPLPRLLAGGSLVDYYVTTSGSDRNPGTQSAPWRTIAHAASVVSAGSTVHVQPGTYTESEITVSQSGHAGSPIAFISDSTLGAVIADRSWHAFNITGSYVTIQGFEVYMTNPDRASAIIETQRQQHQHSQ